MNLKKLYLFLFFSFSIRICGYTQIEVIANLMEFQEKASKGKEISLVELKTMVPSIHYNLRYATKDNFTKTRLYPKSTQHSFLRAPVAKALELVAKELSEMGLGIVVWDAYRPYRITEKFWKLIHDERYVAHPSKGSGHNRGIAIDLTLYDLKTGDKLEMPSDFDDFSEKAHHGYLGLSEKQIQNRELLKRIMEKHQFLSFQTEWWHYSWPEPKKYAILDLRFDELSKLNNATGK